MDVIVTPNRQKMTRYKVCNPATTITVVVAIFFLLSLPGRSLAQVSISPTSVFLGEQSPFANVIISNGADQAQEVSIRFDFGYSVSDEDGTISMRYTDEDHERSLTDHVNAFPRNFLLEPGERQTVRMAVRGLTQGDDGTYWARARILASPMSPPAEETGDEGVAARININFEQVIPVFYRKGDSGTGIRIRNADFTQQDADEGYFLVDLEREGNSPFVGSLQTVIRNRDGEQVLEQNTNLSIYYDMKRRISLNIEELSPGDYTAEFTIRSERSDIASRQLLQIRPVETAQNFRIE